MRRVSSLASSEAGRLLRVLFVRFGQVPAGAAGTRLLSQPLSIDVSQWLRWYLRVLAGLTLVSGLAQLVFPARVAAASAWPVAVGWQREIGFWALAMCPLVVSTLRANDPVAGRSVATALVILQFLAAGNHFAGALQSHGVLNEVMAVANFGCALFGIFSIRVSRMSGCEDGGGGNVV